jgi:hypothetical protein
MSVYAWIIIGLAAGWPAMFCLGLAIGHLVGRGDGYEEGRIDAAQEKIAERRAARVPRHARTAPRRDREETATTPGPFPLVPATGPGWYRPVPPARRAWTDAASIAPVLLAAPGTRIPWHPQPSGTSPRAVTGTLPRLKLTGDDDTGEIRRCGAASVAAIEEGRI